MANVIKHKRGSGSDPVASDLVVGEVAIRTDVGKLFTKMDNGSVAEIAGGGSDIAINTLSSSSATGGGSATFNGSAYRFTLSAPPSVSAQQLLVSINGVIQKPVAGTGQPSEGFSVDGTDIILGDAPATGSDFFILTFKSLGVSEPADNSVTSAKIVDGAIVNADINASAAIAGSKISPDFGSQNITTTGQVFSSYATLTAVNPTLTFNDSDNNPDYTINVNSGVLKITDSTNTADRLVISSSGNVGIGTTSPSAKLEINNTGSPNSELLRLVNTQHDTNAQSSSQLKFGITMSLGERNARIEAKEEANNINNVALDFYTNEANSTDGETVKMRIKGNGNVGIGTSSPAEKLDVIGNIKFGANSNGSIVEDGVALAFKANIAGRQAHIMTHDGNEDINLDPSGFIQFECAGSERMRIDSSGNVGIGTTSPGGFNPHAQELVVRDADGTCGITISTPNDTIGRLAFADPEDDNVGEVRYTHSANTMEFTVNAAERMRIDSSGRLLLGTSTQFGDGNDKLMIENGTTGGRLTFGSSAGFAEPIIGQMSAYWADNKKIAAISFFGGSDTSNKDDGTIRFATSSANNITERMRIDSSGNVGISTTSPSGKLDIQTGTNGNVLIDAEGGSVNHAKIVNDSGDLTLGARNTSADTKLTSQRHIHFLTGSSEAERMRIDSSGNVLIGMTSASTTTQGMMFRPGQESSIFRDSGFNLLVGGAQSGQRLIDFRHNGASIGHISKSGTTGISYNEGSDYRLKENAVAISDGITRLKTLKPYRFNFKADASTTVDGFFAHEVTAVPEAISGTKDEVDENNEPVYQGIDKSKLVPLLVAALQEAIGRIEALEAK